MNAKFAALANVSQQLQTQRPGKLRFINLLPNYFTADDGTYVKGYVEPFVEQVKPNILSMDHCESPSPTPLPPDFFSLLAAHSNRHAKTECSSTWLGEQIRTSTFAMTGLVTCRTTTPASPQTPEPATAQT